MSLARLSSLSPDFALNDLGIVSADEAISFLSAHDWAALRRETERLERRGVKDFGDASVTPSSDIGHIDVSHPSEALWLADVTVYATGNFFVRRLGTWGRELEFASFRHLEALVRSLCDATRIKFGDVVKSFDRFAAKGFLWKWRRIRVP